MPALHSQTSSCLISVLLCFIALFHDLAQTPPAGARPCSEAAARAAADALLTEALRRGTMDNVSVVVALLQWS